mgnify:FL=1
MDGQADGRMQAAKATEAASGADWRGTYLLAAVLVVASGLFTLSFPFGRDQGIHATIGYALGEGLVTYRDVFNIKPPLTTAVHLLSQWLFGHSMVAIRALDLVVTLLAALGLVAIVRRCGLSRTAGAFAALGLVLIYHSLSYWENAQTDGWAGFLVVGAVLAMLSGWARPAGGARRSWMALAGVALGLAFALKYTIGAAGLLVFAPLIARRQARFLPSDLVAVTLGGLAVLAAVALTLAAFGALGPFLDIQGFLRSYIAYETGGIALPRQVLRILQVWPLEAAVMLGAAAMAWDLVRRRAGLFHAIVALWLVAAAVSGLVQGKGFIYHFLPLVPPLALLVALAADRGMKLFARAGLRRPALIAALAGAAMALPTTTVGRAAFGIGALAGPAPVERMRRIIPPGVDFDIHATLAFSERLSARRGPGDGLFVWGYETMLYFLQQEPPRYRYPYSWTFLVDFHDGRYTADLMARLEADPPRHIVVQKQDATPWVTGRAESSHEFLQSFAPLAGFIDRRYRLVDEVPRFELWEIVQ